MKKIRAATEGGGGDKGGKKRDKELQKIEKETPEVVGGGERAAAKTAGADPAGEQEGQEGGGQHAADPADPADP